MFLRVVDETFVHKQQDVDCWVENTLKYDASSKTMTGL